MSTKDAIKFTYSATGIGSVPFKDARVACRIILDTFESIPFWPQLPRRSFLENMYAQYAEQLPGIVIDEERKSIYVDSGRVADKIEEVYQNYLDGNVEYFAISEKFAAGLHEFMGALGAIPKTVTHLKGHITGPISYALQVTDENKKAVIYDKDFFEVLTKTLAMKAKWQIRRFREASPGTGVIIFIDEPYLVSIGSSYITINREEAFAALDEVIVSIKEEGALAGLHCCGNTDWPLLLTRELDILNFDAYNFAKEFSLYGADIDKYLARGSSLAWGVVPSSDDIKQKSPSDLVEKFRSSVNLLTVKGIGRDGISSLITPSCGVGSLDEDVARRVLETTAQVSRLLRQ